MIRDFLEAVHFSRFEVWLDGLLFLCFSRIVMRIKAKRRLMNAVCLFIGFPLVLSLNTLV